MIYLLVLSIHLCYFQSYQNNVYIILINHPFFHKTVFFIYLPLLAFFYNSTFFNLLSRHVTTYIEKQIKAGLNKKEF